MREASGNVPAIAFIMFFIAIVSGYIAFTINYSKAFKVKSKLIDQITIKTNAVYQAYESINKEFDVSTIFSNNDFIGKTDAITNGLAYNASSEYTSTCERDGYKVVEGQGWCYKIITDDSNDAKRRQYVKVRTFVVIDIPIFNKIFPNIRLFNVEGSTSTFTFEKNN